jgi:peptidoglycan/LPS O-acetylase OafA/YrhL
MLGVRLRKMLSGPTLGSACVGRNNNLNLIRMILATSVLVSHSVPLAEGPSITEPLGHLLHITLGSLAVCGFFAISGFLVTQSLLIRESVVSYLQARALRIFPGLAVVLLLTVLVLGPIATTLPLFDYATRSGTWTYFPANIAMIRLQYVLPGVFGTNAYPAAINGSLWTLPFEIGCYITLAIIWLTGAFRSHHRLIWTAMGVAIFYIVAGIVSERVILPLKFNEFMFLSACFTAGAAFYFLRNRVILNNPMALVALAIAVLINFYFPNQYILCAGYFYALLTFGYLPARILGQYNRLGDYSYGMYIYAFPVEQTLEWLSPGLSPLQLCLRAFPATLVCALISWHFVERPSLKMKQQSRAEHARWQP